MKKQTLYFFGKGLPRETCLILALSLWLQVWGNNFTLSKDTVFCENFKCTGCGDTISIVNTISDTLLLDSVYIDSFQLVNNKIPTAKWGAIGFYTFPLDTFNYDPQYGFEMNRPFYGSISKKIHILPKSTFNMLRFSAMWNCQVCKKAIAQSSAPDTATLRLVLRSGTFLDTLTVIGFLSSTNVLRGGIHRSEPFQLQKKKMIVNALGRKLEQAQKNSKNISKEKITTQLRDK